MKLVWFTDQNSQPLEIEDRIDVTMVIKKNIYKTRFYRMQLYCIKTRYSIEPGDRIYVKKYGFFVFF